MLTTVTRRWAILACLVFILTGGAGAETYQVRSRQLTVTLSASGEVIGVSRGQERVPVTAHTSLVGCAARGEVSVRGLGHGMQFSRVLVSVDGQHRCAVTERFTSAANSVRWEIEIHGDGKPWTAPIRTEMLWPNAKDSLFWTAWDDSRPGNTQDWTDPLDPKPFADLKLTYGGTDPWRQDSFGIPIASVLDSRTDLGLSLALSPEDSPSDVKLVTTAQGSIAFVRNNLRISSDRPVRLSMDIAAHAAYPRSALGWMVSRYPRYFEPTNKRVYDVSGCGAYSCYEGPLDAGKFAAMGFGINWKASFDYPYMGMFIPPVSDTETWINDRNTLTSISQLREYSRSMRAVGFHVLSYFNVTDFGKNVTYPAPPRKATNDKDLWRDANDLTHGTLSDAMLFLGQDKIPLGAWEGGVALDPGEPCYQRFMLDQAKRHIEKIPASEGICIDRMDYARLMNPNRDDGVTWLGDRPGRSLMASWNSMLSKLGPLMHRAGKVVYANPLTGRLDLMSQLDGFYDEFGSYPSALNVSALLGLLKPTTAWIGSAPDLAPDPDTALQRYLYLGVFTTVPYPQNDHSILPDPSIEAFYLDYGPMFQALKGRRWVLREHIVEVEAGKARANVFEVPGGFVVPVVLGGANRSARLTLRNLPGLGGPDAFRVTVLHPGETTASVLPATSGGKALHIDVPLGRGCALVKLSRIWLDPAQSWFTHSTQVRMGTTIHGATIRYTMDGTEPTPDSPVYVAPIEVKASANIRMASFVDDRLSGSVMSGQYVRIPPSAPVISSSGAFFDGSTQVELALPRGCRSGEIHYTLDGKDPSIHSPKYSGPIALTETSTLKARVFQPGMDPGVVETATFRKTLPLPPTPNVFISDLKPLKATTGCFERVKEDRSTQGQVLSVAGKQYAKGMGVSAVSEMVYDLRPEYKEFVAVVGVDDEMRQYTQASITFRVTVDGKLLTESPVLHAGEFWHLRVPMPEGGRTIQLVATDAGDGINCDHADWANAGFLR